MNSNILSLSINIFESRLLHQAKKDFKCTSQQRLCKLLNSSIFLFLILRRSLWHPAKNVRGRNNAKSHDLRKHARRLAD
uniref:Uncharacterized protein n=1 Tax=Anguilla anguilla TaxID=7936 RepID=A0A0E9X0A1_ANGAN